MPELAEIAHLVMRPLRHMPPSEAREPLTRQIAILAGVLRQQIGRALAELRRNARRASPLRVDGDSARHARLAGGQRRHHGPARRSRGAGPGDRRAARR
jgi:hypothetical protein